MRTIRRKRRCARRCTAGSIMGRRRMRVELIPLCHIVPLTNCEVTFTTDENTILLRPCATSCVGKTGVEMEALTGVSTALLTIYDMQGDGPHGDSP